MQGPNPAEFFRIADFAKRHPQYITSARALRWHVAHRATNGMVAAGVVVETAMGVLMIHEPSYFAWLFRANDSQGT